MYPIPAGVTRIRYLESTGTQYINAGVVVTNSVEFITRAMSRGYYSDGLLTGLFGNRTSNAANDGTCIGRTANNVYSSHGASSTWQPVRISSNVWHNIEYADSTSDGRSLVFDGTSYSNSAVNTKWPSYGAFAILGAGPNGSGGMWRIAFAKVIADDILVRDFIPVRIGKVGYLFDRISGQLFGNAGTGDFVLGPDMFSQGVIPTRTMPMGVWKNLATTWDYVQDGLVAMWDGIENAGRGIHDANATVWKDLVSGADVSWAGPTFDQSTWHWMPDGFDFSTTDANYRLFRRSSMPSALVNAFNSGTYSIECVFERSAQRNSGIADFRSKANGFLIATGTMASNIQIYSKNNTWSWGGVSDAQYPANAFGVRSSLAGTWTGPDIGGNIYKDGTFIKTYTDPVVLTDSKYTATADSIIAIGGYASTNQQNSGRNQLGKIYAVRLYKRTLTAAEIAQNHAIDQIRFNLPIT